MMLINKFFSVISSEYSNNVIKASIRINGEHSIFKGHFPEVPIVPGVCMLQITKEMVELQLGKTMKVAEADNMKFLSVINPNDTPELQSEIKIEEATEGLKITASLFKDTTSFFKLKALLIVA